MSMLKMNLLILLTEVYIVIALLFEINVPGTSYLREAPTVKLLIALLPIGLTLISKHIEGWNLVILPTLACSLLIPIAAVTEGLTKLVLAVVIALLVVAHLTALRTFRVKQLFKSSGKFSVGYRHVKDKARLNYAVFYPTLKPTSKYPKFLDDADSFRKGFELIRGTSKFPPKWFYEIMTQLYKVVALNASVGAPLISPEELQEYTQSDSLIPIIFSHGLGGNRNSYTSLCCQLASQGYFVISMEHMEEVKEILSEMDKGAPKYLELRVEEVRGVMEELQTGKGSINPLFENKLKIDMSRLTIMGHSYGGCTAYKTACEDTRVKSCVMLDPWLKPVPFEKLDKQLKCNILLIESGDWNEVYPGAKITLSNTKVMEANKKSGNSAIYCKIPESQHSHFSDDILLSGGVIQSFKIIKSADVAEKIYRASIKALEDYCSVIVVKNQETKNFVSLYDGDLTFPFVTFS